MLARAAVACLQAVVLSGALLTAAAAAEEPYPARPVRIVLPLPAGAAPDIRMRIIAERLADVLGRRVLIENRPGAGGLIGTQGVLSAPHDGYTLLAAPSSVLTILPAQRNDLPFDLARDLVPLGLVASEAMVVAVSARLGVKSLEELFSLARSRPEGVVIGTNPAGSLPNLAAKMLAARSGAPITVLPYATGGTPETLRDILGGRVHGIVESVAALRGPMAAGDLVPVSVMARERVAGLPEVPAAAETLPGLTAVGWVALFAPRDVPAPAIGRLTDALRATLADPGVKARLEEIGTPFAPLYGAELARFIAEDRALWEPVVRRP